MSYSARTINAIPNATILKETHWVLNAAGAGVDTQTIIIGGVTFTTVTNIGATAGNVLLGANQAATLTNLTALINDPYTTTSTGVKLSANDAYLIKEVYGLSATTTATDMTIISSKKLDSLVVSETETNFSWSSYFRSDPIALGGVYGKTSIQFIASGISSGNGVFTVEVSNDGTNWTAYNRLTTNATNTNGQTDVRVASVTINSNTSAVVTFPSNDVFTFLRVKLVPTTDGTYNAYVRVA
jgi:hypothetical protein